MKRLLFFFALITLFSCSSNEDDSPEEVQDPISITNDSWEKTEQHNIDGEAYWQMRITATVKNEGNEPKTGLIRFVIEAGTARTYLNSDEFTIAENSTMEVDKELNVLLTQPEITAGYDYVEFIESK